MIRTQSTFSSLMAGALVFGSLGLSGFVGAVASMAREDGGVKSVAPPKNAVEAANDLEALPSTASQSDQETIPAPNEGLIARSNKNVMSENVNLDLTRQKLGIRLSKDGLVTGRLNITDSVSGVHVAAENLNIKFVQRGSTLSQVKPGPGGVFQADGLLPGVYSMIATGPDGFFGCGLTISPYIDGAAQDSLQIDATVVHPANVPMVQKLIRERSPGPKFFAPRRVEFTPAGHRVAQERSAPLHTPILNVGADGHVFTRVNDIDEPTGARILGVGATVYLLQRGAVRGRYQVVQDGSFYAPGLVPGQYSLLALSQRSQASFAAVGVIVENGGRVSNTVNKPSSRLAVQLVKSVNLQEGSDDIDMMPSSDFNSTEDFATDDRRPDGDAFGGGGTGGFGGGGAGGGGGGFGGGGLGALGLAGGAAGLAAALSRRHNNDSSPKGP